MERLYDELGLPVKLYERRGRSPDQIKSMICGSDSNNPIYSLR